MRKKAILIDRNLKNGWDFIRDEVSLGKIYYVDLDFTAKMEFGRRGNPLAHAALDCVMAYDNLQGGYGDYLPLELLRIETDA